MYLGEKNSKIQNEEGEVWGLPSGDESVKTGGGHTRAKDSVA